MQRTIIIIVIILAILLGGYWVYRYNIQQQDTQEAYTPPTNDSPDALQQDLNKVEIDSSFDAEFEKTDNEIKGL